MLLFGDKKFIQAPFENEEELEGVVAENYEYIFGPNSFYLPKKLIRTSDGSGTIPDGFAVDLAVKKWFIVEAELLKHSVWSHIAPQVSKQIIASQQPESRKLLALLAIEAIKKQPEKFDELDIDKFKLGIILNEILEKPPLIGLPIDNISDDLADWAETLRNPVNIWLIKKYVEVGNPNNIIYELPEEYKPLIDTEEDNTIIEGETERKIKTYNISVYDLIQAGLITPGDELIMSYKPRTGEERKEYKTIVDEDGNFHVLGEKYSSPSYAALAGLQDAGSDRKTVNGWTSWRTSEGKTLADLRQDYLKLKEKISEQGAAPDRYSAGAS
jgi:hypothetical protein